MTTARWSTADGNKALRLIPLASERQRARFLGADGLGRCSSFANGFPISAHKAFLKPDPARVAEFRARLSKLPAQAQGRHLLAFDDAGRQAARNISAPIDGWGPILKTPGVSFVNLQYGDCAAELARAADAYGVDHPSDRGAGPAERYRRRRRAVGGAGSGDLRADRRGRHGRQRRRRSLVPRPPAAPGRSSAPTNIPGIADTRVFRPESSATGRR